MPQQEHNVTKESSLDTQVFSVWERNVITAVKTRRKLLITVLALCVLVFSGFLMLLPKRYESSMKLLVKNERQDLIVTPERNVNTIHASELPETEVNSEIELLRSADVLRTVALKSGLAHEPGSVMAAGAPSPIALSKAIDRLEHYLDISPVKKSDIIEVSYQAASPALATKVLNELAETYLEAHLRVHGAPGTYTFFSDEADDYKRALDRAEDNLRNFQSENSLLVTPDAGQVLVQRTVDVQAALDEAEAQISDYEKRVEGGNHQIASMDARVTAQVHTAPQSLLVQQLTEMLAQLKNKRTELLTKFNPEDRLVAEVDAQIKQTNTALDAAIATPSVDTATDVNAVRQDAEKNFVTAAVTLAGLKARRARLALIISQYQANLRGLSQASIQHEQLVRAVKENEENYLLYSHKREEARIAQSLDKQRITNVALVQAPTTPVEASSPRMGIDLLIIVLLSALIAFVTAFIAQLLDAPRLPSAVRTL